MLNFRSKYCRKQTIGGVDVRQGCLDAEQYGKQNMDNLIVFSHLKVKYYVRNLMIDSIWIGHLFYPLGLC